jgi:hypothetical protein
MQLLHILQILVLLTFANGTPIVAKKIFGSRFALPLALLWQNLAIDWRNRIPESGFQ